MSKIGKQPVLIPEGVKMELFDSQVKVLGPKGELSFKIRPEIKVLVEDDRVKVIRKSETKFAKSLHGLTRSIIANMVKGVTAGHQDDLVLNVGYSHPVIIPKVNGVQIETKENKVIVVGVDKALVGEVAARIRRVRPPEPYKGKGIRYHDEVIRRKAGKAVKSAGGAI
ncbi:50S ribosomal protein L6 [Candidatus Curtissbacteria bacterium]|nr:50S ribosomal protein L6 [Candidatus Curtissbacteria bacterium]